METITFYRVNRVWYDIESKSMLGDIFWSIQEADNSITENLDELIDSLLLSIKENVEYDDVQFPIYYIEKCVAECDAEHEDIWEVDKTFCGCPKELADKLELECDFYPIK